MDSGRLQAVLFGGLLVGVLSALPIVKAGNCCCCLWVVTGGMLAVYLHQQNSHFAVTSAEGALVGLLAGLVGGILDVLFSIPVDAMTGPFERRFVEWVLSTNPDIPGDMREMLERAGTGSGSRSAVLAFKLAFSTVSGAIFGMLGGLLGVAVFRKDVPPPPPGTVEVLPPEG